MLLPLALLWACTTEPMTAVSDFDYEFEGFDDIVLGTEIDTAVVEIEFEEVEEDTSHFETQSAFATDVAASAENNERPENLVEAGQAAADALDDDDEEELSEVEENAREDVDAAAEELESALEDENSAQSQLARRVQDAAAQQAVLADLLGLSPPSGKASMREAPDVLPVPRSRELFDITAPLGILVCPDDAQAQFDEALARITAQRDRGLAAVTRTFERSVAKVDSFRAAVQAVADTNRVRRRQQARGFFVQVRAAITIFLDAELITEEEADQMRVTNALILVVNLYGGVQNFKERIAAMNAAADEALQKAVAKRDSQESALTAAFEEALDALEQELEDALQLCHDQGQTTS